MTSFVFPSIFLLTVAAFINHLDAEHVGEPRGGKWQDDHWSWGYVDVTHKNRENEEQKSTDPPTTTEEPNPCSIQPPKVPNFYAPGRRISDQDDHWSWGYVDVTHKNRENEEQKSTDPPTTTEEPNPCSIQPPKVPNFYAPGRRISDQDDHWSWGYVDVTHKNRENEEQKSTDPPTTTEEPNPCSIQPPKVPNFYAPGRRISDVKCYEYIYDIKVREEKARINKACEEYNKKKGNFFGIAAIGGRDTLPGEFPHMGAIGWKAAVGTWIFKCGGSLISDKFVLTAAHCSKASERDTSIADVVPKIVRLGDKNIADVLANNSLPTTANIKRVIEHPRYKSPKKYFDIALMELAEPVQFTEFIQPACLWTGDSSALVGQKATLTGWGVVETASRTTSPELQAAVVDIFNSPLCDRLLTPSCNRHWCAMQDHQLCAGKLAGGVDACQGDSGGPLQTKIPLPATTKGRMYHIVGVTSFGIGCALPNLPGIYTRVSSFVDWIEAIVWK